jgi:hypothetical protein
MSHPLPVIPRWSGVSRSVRGIHKHDGQQGVHGVARTSRAMTMKGGAVLPPGYPSA